MAGNRSCIDQAGQFISEKEDIVLKQIGMDDARWQVLRPVGAEEIDIGRDFALQTGLDLVGPISGFFPQNLPAFHR